MVHCVLTPSPHSPPAALFLRKLLLGDIFFLLSLQNNIKEVLLFPAMKPEENAVQQSTSRGIGMPPQGGVISTGAIQPTTSHPAVLVSGSGLLDGVDLASTAGIQKLEVDQLTNYVTSFFYSRLTNIFPLMEFIPRL